MANGLESGSYGKKPKIALTGMESGMGCTGAIIRVSDASLEKARDILTAEGYIG